MIRSILSALFHWSIIAIIRVLFILTGIPIVAIALPFAHEVEGSKKPFIEHPGYWTLINLPAWAWFWDNKRDGALGDMRGWYWVVGAPQWMREISSTRWRRYLKQWNWMAIRNPANNSSRFTPGLSCNTAEATTYLIAGQDYVRDRPGNEGWQFVGSRGKYFRYYGFYYISKWRIGSRALLIRIGHKIEPRHNTEDWTKDPQKAWKGSTFRMGLKNI